MAGSRLEGAFILLLGLGLGLGLGAVLWKGEAPPPQAPVIVEVPVPAPSSPEPAGPFTDVGGARVLKRASSNPGCRELIPMRFADGDAFLAAYQAYGGTWAESAMAARAQRDAGSEEWAEPMRRAWTQACAKQAPRRTGSE